MGWFLKRCMSKVRVAFGRRPTDIEPGSLHFEFASKETTPPVATYRLWENLLLETDEDYRGRLVDQRPSNIFFTAAFLAILHGHELDRIGAICRLPRLAWADPAFVCVGKLVPPQGPTKIINEGLIR